MIKQKGLTLMTLVITIVVLILISTVTINISLDVYNGTKEENFISRLKVIQAKVDNMAEEAKNNNIDIAEAFKGLELSSLEESNPELYNAFSAIITNPKEYNIDVRNSWDNESDSDIENYYYFSPKDLETKLGLKNQEINVIVNFDTRNVITSDYLKKDDLKYYRQYELSGGEILVNNPKDEYTSASLRYVTDGLVLHYDGIMNTATGHSSTTKKWKDLSGNGNDLSAISDSNVTWSENSLNFNNSNKAIVIASDSVNTNIKNIINSNVFTMQFLLNKYEYHSNTAWPTILWSGNDKFSFYTEKNNWEYFRFKNNGNAGPDIQKVDAINKMVTIVFDLNNNVVKEYSNTQLVDSETISNQIGIDNLNFSRDDQITTFGINNLRIYDTALSNSQIEKNYRIDKSRFGIE